MKDIYQLLEDEQDPKAKMHLLLTMSKGFLNNDLERCKNTAFELLALGKNHNLPEATMHHFLVMGRITYRRGELDNAFDYFKSAQAIALQIDHFQGKANCLESFGLIHNKQGQHTEALGLIMSALELYKANNAHNGLLGLAYNNMANTFNYLKQTEDAEKYYRLSIEALEDSERKHSVNLIKGNLGLILFQKGDYHEAIANLEAGLEGFIAQNNVQAQSQAYSHLGNCYVELNKLVNALEAFQKGLKIIRTRDFPTELASIYQGLGRLYSKMSGYIDAEIYLMKALEVRLEKAYWSDACETYLNLIELYQKTGDNEKAAKALADGKKLSIEKSLKHREEEFDKYLL